jgi:hypothetical protein
MQRLLTADPLHARQTFSETCRVRFTHHRKRRNERAFFRLVPFWCAARTLHVKHKGMFGFGIHYLSKIVNQPFGSFR